MQGLPEWKQQWGKMSKADRRLARLEKLIKPEREIPGMTVILGPDCKINYGGNMPLPEGVYRIGTPEAQKAMAENAKAKPDYKDPHVIVEDKAKGKGGKPLTDIKGIFIAGR